MVTMVCMLKCSRLSESSFRTEFDFFFGRVLRVLALESLSLHRFGFQFQQGPMILSWKRSSYLMEHSVCCIVHLIMYFLMRYSDRTLWSWISFLFERLLSESIDHKSFNAFVQQALTWDTSSLSKTDQSDNNENTSFQLWVEIERL